MVKGRLKPAADNVVVRVSNALGGVAEAAKIAGVTPTTLYAWEREGIVSRAAACLRLAEAAAPKLKLARWSLARRLAGLD